MCVCLDEFVCPNPATLSISRLAERLPLVARLVERPSHFYVRANLGQPNARPIGPYELETDRRETKVRGSNKVVVQST